MTAIQNMCGKHEVVWFTDGPCPDCEAGMPASPSSNVPLHSAYVGSMLNLRYSWPGWRLATVTAPTTSPDYAKKYWETFKRINREVAASHLDEHDVFNSTPEPLVIESDSFPCGGTYGAKPCEETLTEADTVNGHVVCWRCGWRKA